MQKEVWVDCGQQDLENLAIELNATGIIGKSKRGVKTLPKSSVEVELRSQDDVEEVVTKYRGKVPYVIATFPTEWRIVPLENLISRLQGSRTKIAVRTNNPKEMQSYFTGLEVGADAVIVSEGKRIKDACSLLKPRVELQLVDAEVKEVKRLDYVGDRACVDLITTQYPREGILVGNVANFMVLQDSETEKNAWVDTRDFRINAGPVGLYILLKPGKTKYLKDLCAGDEVSLVDAEGRTRGSYVVRIKIERRQMGMVRVEYDGKTGVAFPQYAETVRLVSPDGSIPVTKIKPGDEVKAYVTEPVGMHFGTAVEEYIVEK